MCKISFLNANSSLSLWITNAISLINFHSFCISFSTMICHPYSLKHYRILCGFQKVFNPEFCTYILFHLISFKASTKPLLSMIRLLAYTVYQKQKKDGIDFHPSFALTFLKISIFGIYHFSIHNGAFHESIPDFFLC